MRFLLNSIGTAGDVHPMIGVGLALKRRGHEVAVLANPHFAERIGRVGLGFWPLGTEEQYRAMVTGADLVHRSRGPRYVLTSLMLPAMRPTLEAMTEIARAFRPEAVLAHHICLAMPAACERLRIPCATAVLAPLFWLSRCEPIVYPTAPVEDLPRWADAALRRLMRLYGRGVIDRLTNRERRRLGLPGIRNLIYHETRGLTVHRRGPSPPPRPVLALWSPHYRPRLEDDPGSGRICGFSWFDRAMPPEPGTEQAIARFMDAGDPPVVFTLGTSVVHHGQDFYQLGADACARIGRRALLLVGSKEAAARPWPSHTLAVSYAPLSRVLPRGCCTVHHGGIGTTAQAMRAGVPSLTIPFANDEFDNAARARRCGVAATLPRRRLDVKTLASALDAACRDHALIGSAAVMGKKLLGEDGAEAAADELEKMGAIGRIHRVRAPAMSPGR